MNTSPLSFTGFIKHFHFNICFMCSEYRCHFMGPSILSLSGYIRSQHLETVPVKNVICLQLSGFLH